MITLSLTAVLDLQENMQTRHLLLLIVAIITITTMWNLLIHGTILCCCFCRIRHPNIAPNPPPPRPPMHNNLQPPQGPEEPPQDEPNDSPQHPPQNPPQNPEVNPEEQKNELPPGDAVDPMFMPQAHPNGEEQQQAQVEKVTPVRATLNALKAMISSPRENFRSIKLRAKYENVPNSAGQAKGARNMIGDARTGLT